VKRVWVGVVTVAVVALLFAVFAAAGPGFTASNGVRSLLRTLVSGLQFGTVYALVGLGIALVYRSTRVLNFTQGELGTVPVLIIYTIMVGGPGKLENIAADPDPSQLWWNAIIAVVLGAVLAVLINVLVIRRLASASPVISLVATAGIALMLTTMELAVYQAQVRIFPRFIAGAPCVSYTPDGECVPLRIASITIPWHAIIAVAVLMVTVVILALFFRTQPGYALLASAQEPFAAQLQGISVERMSTLAWGAAGALGAIGGLMAAGVFEHITPGFVTVSYLIPAFTGAVLGGITSMVGAVVGGLLLGLLVNAVSQLNLAYNFGISGIESIAVFAVLLLVLGLRPRGLLGKEA
jgi:branched-chain amino acid transport system permease protein